MYRRDGERASGLNFIMGFSGCSRTPAGCQMLRILCAHFRVLHDRSLLTGTLERGAFEQGAFGGKGDERICPTSLLVAVYICKKRSQRGYELGPVALWDTGAMSKGAGRGAYLGHDNDYSITFFYTKLACFASSLVGQCRVLQSFIQSTSLVPLAPRDKAAGGTTLSRFRPKLAATGLSLRRQASGDE